MIKGNIQNVENCYSVSEKFQKSFMWLKNNDLENMPEGRYEISDDIYANVQSYYTKEDAPYEAHREHLDIQYMIKGEENIGIAQHSSCSVLEEYNKERDVEFLNYDGEEHIHKLSEGDFFVFFPNDAHKPCLNTDASRCVKKLVIKVRL
jgi:YhcH/YjgK/YiaL family protein